MAARTSRKGQRKFKPRRTARGHRQSTTGIILPPLDVRSSGAIGELMTRIRKGPLTVVLVYADWCGHCHHFMPHFDKAAKNSNRSIQAAKVNETVMSEVNEALKRKSAKPIKVEGYPSVLLVGQNGNEITQIEPVKDTNAMMEVMNRSANLANEAGLVNHESSAEESGITSEMKASIHLNNERNSPPKVASLKASVTPDFIANEEMDMGESEGVSIALNNRASAVKKARNNNEPSLAAPPSMNEDRDMENMNEPVKKGGSLYTALSQSAYTLAAPAALLATAALMMKRKTNKKRHHRHHRKHGRHTRRRV